MNSYNLYYRYNHRREQTSKSGMAKLNLTIPGKVKLDKNYRNFQYKLQSDPLVGDWKCKQSFFIISYLQFINTTILV